MFEKLLRGLGVVLAGFTVFAAGADGPARADDRPSLVVAMQEIRTELDPLHPRAIALSAFRTLESVYDKPFSIDFDKGGEVVPALAERIEQIDETTYDMTIRRGVKFHDGTEMTAQDVAFTFGTERMLSESARATRWASAPCL